MSHLVEEICELLESYRGRDKVVRLSCYVLKLWGSLTKDDGMLKASSRLSAARVALRLFDDIPTTRHTIQYGLGSHEIDTSSAILGVIGNLVDQVFLAVEKICFMSDVGMLKLKPDITKKFDTLNTALWASSLYIALLKTIKQIRSLSMQTECLEFAIKGEELKRKINVKYNIEKVMCAKLCIDIVHAVNCLPDGWLWGGKLDGVQIGAIASVSSLVSIALHFSKKRLLK